MIRVLVYAMRFTAKEGFYLVLFLFGAKTEEDLQQKGTICISYPESPKGTTVRQGTIIRLLLVWWVRTGKGQARLLDISPNVPGRVYQSFSWHIIII